MQCLFLSRVKPGGCQRCCAAGGHFRSELFFSPISSPGTTQWYSFGGREAPTMRQASFGIYPKAILSSHLRERDIQGRLNSQQSTHMQHMYLHTWNCCWNEVISTTILCQRAVPSSKPRASPGSSVVGFILGGNFITVPSGNQFIRTDGVAPTFGPRPRQH